MKTAIKQRAGANKLESPIVSMLRFCELIGIASGISLVLALPHKPLVWGTAFVVGGIADFALTMIERRARR